MSSVSLAEDWFHCKGVVSQDGRYRGRLWTIEKTLLVNASTVMSQARSAECDDLDGTKRKCGLTRGERHAGSCHELA